MFCSPLSSEEGSSYVPEGDNERMDMWRLIIADDEPIIRNGLKNNVDWSALNLSIAGVFSCGHDVIRFLEENTADVVLTDVRMNDGSGLDVAEWINVHRPGMQVVLLTGYTDYDVARRAINLSVVRHLANKPLSLPQLKTVFVSLTEELEKRRAHQQMQHKVHQECLQQVLSGMKDADRLWDNVGLQVLGVTPAQAHDAVPPLYSERLSQGFEGVETRRGQTTLWLYPCMGEHAAELEGAARLALETHAAFAGAEMCLYASARELLSALEALDSQTRQSGDGKLLAAIDEYLMTHMADKVTLQEAAAHLHYSPSHFSRKFKEQTGVGFASYVLNVKLNYARQLLRTTDQSISEIAAAASFDNTHHFAQVFKKVTGTTPTSYRRHPPRED